ncbi:hypothetical protein FHT78_001827 [Rhizobium sp. BK196]|jgi:hypothetical protein|nr:hypothetical protein [Rhizobium sp. BK196]
MTEKKKKWSQGVTENSGAMASKKASSNPTIRRGSPIH